MRKLYTSLFVCLFSIASAFAADNVYTLKLENMMQTLVGEYQQEITFDQANSSYTFADFLGSGCSFTIKLEPQENSSLAYDGKPKYIVPGEGTYDVTIWGGKGFAFTGFADKWSKPLTLNGQDALMVKNPEVTLMQGYSYADYVETDPNKMEIVMFIQTVSKTYTDGAWGEEQTNQMFNVKVEVPFALPGSTGIDAIEAENAPVEYFNLQGMPVSNPAPGQFVIRRQGNKTSKVIIR